MSAHRRGICPTLMDPLPTGDGLLARWLPLAPVPLDSFMALCDATARYGNGIIEVTQRGSLQFRGFTEATSAVFSTSVQTLGLAANTAPPIRSSPLLGLDPEVPIDLRDWLLALRSALDERYAAHAINPKLSLIVDDGGAVLLNDIYADLRLELGPASRLHVKIDGTARDARVLGWAAPERATELVCGILDRIAARGRAARSRDLVRDIEVLQACLPIEQLDTHDPPRDGKAEPLGAYRLEHDRLARGVGLPFGYGSAAQLKKLAIIAQRVGANEVCPAPQRVLLVIGILPERMLDFETQAKAAGFIVTGDDVRRHVVACAGAPACQSAMMATRELAPQVADAARHHLSQAAVVHLSGCAKGCAHPGAAAVTFVGPDRLILGGRADGATLGHVTPAEFIARIPELLAAAQR